MKALHGMWHLYSKTRVLLKAYIGVYHLVIYFIMLTCDHVPTSHTIAYILVNQSAEI